MSTLNELTEVTSLLDTDYFYMRRAADVDDPDKKVPATALRPAGTKIGGFVQFDGIVTIPTISSNSSTTFTFPVTGALEGDFIVPSWTDGMPTGLGVVGIRVSDIDTVEIRMRNFAGTSFTTADVPLTCLFIRTA